MRKTFWADTFDGGRIKAIESLAWPDEYYCKFYDKEGKVVASKLLNQDSLMFYAAKCCNGNMGDRYDATLQAWFCKDCGAKKSDPAYVGTTKIYKPGVEITLPQGIGISSDNVCECGSDKLGSDRHSQWCPKNG